MSITDAYDYTDLLIEKLQEGASIISISKQFNDIKDNAERVKFLETLLKENNLIPKIKNFHKPKNNKTSVEYRNQGNKYYMNRQFLEALECYNKSLCFGENDETIGIAYANRAAVYCELKLYKRALKNIELAIENKYPDKNINKLLKRKQNCEECINEDAEEALSTVIGEKFLRMTHQANENLPFIAKCLKLKSDNQFGRYIVTDMNLSAGDIIAIEEPFSKALLPNCAYRYCINCLNDNFLDLFSCDQCTAVMFCSKQCQETGMEKFHKYECKIIHVLNGIYTKIMRIANHTFFEALFLYDNNIEQVMSAMNENENSSTTVYDFTLESESNANKKQVFMAIDALVTNENERSSADLFQRAGIVAIMTHLLLDYTNLKHLLDTDDKKDFYRRFVMKQTQISALNYHGIFDGTLSQSELDKNVQCGSGSYPFCSLINHSCTPNLVRVSHKCKNYIMTNRPIKAGEQIFDNYGYHHCLETLQERQVSLKNQYMFKCSCEACQRDFPLFPHLKFALHNKSIIKSDDIAKLQGLNLETAENRFQYFCEMLNELDNKGHYPCSEISSLQECLLRCFFIFKLTNFNLKLVN